MHRIREGRSFAAAASVIAITSAASAQFPQFEDLPPGPLGGVGTSFVTHGVPASLECFEWSGGTVFCGGSASIEVGSLPCNLGHRLATNNINATFDFAGSIGPQNDLRFRFGEFGGNINLAVNGDFVNFENFIDIDGLALGGCVVRVLSGGLGGDCGAIEITGVTEKLMIGGQEFWVDGFFAEGLPCRPLFGYEDLPLGASYGNFTSFITDGVRVDSLPLPTPGGGGPIVGGAVIVDGAGMACGDGKDLALSNALAVHRFAASIGTVQDPSWRYGWYGGFVTLTVNGDVASKPSIFDLDGAVVGGCLVRIIPFGPGSNCGVIQLFGRACSVGIGGQELWIDCGRYPLASSGVPGDVDGDGVVDGTDLGLILGAWGPCGIPGGCPTDLNCDGRTDGADLGIVLSNWS